MKTQLNVGNVFAKNEFTAVTLHTDGTPAMVRLAPPRTWFVTSSFDF